MKEKISFYFLQLRLLAFVFFSGIALAKLNLNTATEVDLTNLNGIGKVKDQRIIEYRKTKGKFKSIEELKNVKGIGDKLFQKIKKDVCLGKDGK